MAAKLQDSVLLQAVKTGNLIHTRALLAKGVNVDAKLVSDCAHFCVRLLQVQRPHQVRLLQRGDGGGEGEGGAQALQFGAQGGEELRLVVAHRGVVDEPAVLSQEVEVEGLDQLGQGELVLVGEEGPGEGVEGQLQPDRD